MPYPSKILLFGEHSVMKGSRALASPFDLYYGKWEWAEPGMDFLPLQQDLERFADYLARLSLIDLKTLRRDLRQGLFFASNIPLGYGAGSSGALCAAILDRYGPLEKKWNLSELRGYFGKMESFFHGSSSGTDPLVSYLKAPIVIEADQSIHVVAPLQLEEAKAHQFFLLDTGMRRETAPFVNWFLQQCEQSAYLNRIREELIPLNSEMIDATLAKNWDALFHLLDKVSIFQFQYFKRMIPNELTDLWRQSLDNSAFKLKICGAGGGGFLFGMSKEELPENQLAGYPVIKI